MEDIKSFEQLSKDYTGNKEVIGSGSYGMVFVIIAKPFPVVIKEAKIDTEFDCYSNVKQEFNTLKVIGKHPNIIEIFNAYDNEADLRFAFAMQFADGGTVHDELARRANSKEYEECAAFTQGDLIGFCIKILGALDYIHEKGFCHLDLKPEILFYSVRKNSKKENQNS